MVDLPTKRVNVLVVSKSHAYAHDALQAMFASMDGINTTLVEQPAAQVVLQPEFAAAYDAIFFYDMCGIPGSGMSHDSADANGLPAESYVRAIENLLAAGKGLVLVNHATVSWPRWPLWREITGSSFMLSEGELHGRITPGSGYRGGHGPLPNATVMLSPASEHPVLTDLEAGFSLTDELYLKTSEYEHNVVPLLRADYEFVMDNFTPPPLASAEEQASWQHPPGSNLVVWANACRNSPIVVSDVGDSPLAYDDPNYRRLIKNALTWVASDEARTWAARQTSI